MKAVAVVVGAGMLAISLSLPGLLFAQEPLEPPAAEEPPAPVEEPPAPEPGAEPPAAEPVPPPSGEAQAVPGEDQAAATDVVAKASTSVSMQDYSFSPASLSIAVGDSVTWVNDGEEDHTATGGGFDTGIVAPGASATETFSSAGTFSYVCTLHSNMKGTLTVSGPSASGQPSGDGTTPTAPGTEAAAGLAPDAAGSADALPASGESEGPLVVLGAGLFACGALAAALARQRAREALPHPPA